MIRRPRRPREPAPPAHLQALRARLTEAEGRDTLGWLPRHLSMGAALRDVWTWAP